MIGVTWLGVAIASEVIATTALKMSDGFGRLAPVLVMVAGYGVAFFSLSLSLRTIPLGIAYAVWSGVGTVGAVAAGRFLFGESLGWPQYTGVAVVIVGVALMNLGKAGVA